MSNEINYRHDATGETLYATIERANDAKIWDAIAEEFVTEVVADWADYAVNLSETPVSGYRYLADFPVAIEAGIYIVRIHNQAGGAPALTDEELAGDDMDWDGAAEVGSADVVVDTTAIGAVLDGVKAKTDNLPADPAGISDLPSEPPTAQQNAAAVLAADVDSTGQGLTVAKAIEVIAALMGGVASYSDATGQYVVKGRDGATTIMTVTLDGLGDRTASEIA